MTTKTFESTRLARVGYESERDPDTTARPDMLLSVVHAIPGRVRLRAGEELWRIGTLEGIAVALQQDPSIAFVRLSRFSASMTIFYDSSLDEVLQLVANALRARTSAPSALSLLPKSPRKRLHSASLALSGAKASEDRARVVVVPLSRPLTSGWSTLAFRIALVAAAAL